MKKLSLILLGVLSLFIINCSKKEIKSITMAGSTTVLPIAQACAESYMNNNPKINISVRGGGSSVGIKSILEGSVDLGNASRQIKDVEAKEAAEKGIALKEIVVAYDAIAIIVNSSNNLREISSENLKKIYLGEIKNWKELGGEISTNVSLSLMAQYFPTSKVKNHPNLNRKLTEKEYKKVVDYAIKLGFKNIFTQDINSSDNYLPSFFKEDEKIFGE